MATSNHEVLQTGRALDRIERALANADFLLNRRFLSSTTYIRISPDQIEEDLIVPLDNAYCNIPATFFDEKKKLQSVLYDMEEVTEAMRIMLSATDPAEVVDVYEDVIAPHIGGGQRNMYFSADFFTDEDFFAAVDNHKARLAKLRELGIEGAYLKLLDTFSPTITERLAEISFSANTEIIRVTVTYDADTMRNATVEIVAEQTDQPTPFVASSRKGEQIIFYGVASPQLERAADKSVAPVERVEIVRSVIWKFTRPFQEAVDTLFLGEDLVAL